MQRSAHIVGRTQACRARRRFIADFRSRSMSDVPPPR